MDSYCERETLPIAASIGTVGMQSLTSSKLYGVTRTTDTCDCACSGPPGCAGGTYANASCSITGATACGSAALIPARPGPGKHNFIGFDATTCTAGGVAIPVANLQMEDTFTDAQCTVGVTSYKMGVYGHISGTDFIGIQIQHNGVVNERAAGADPVTQNLTCV